MLVYWGRRVILFSFEICTNFSYCVLSWWSVLTVDSCNGKAAAPGTPVTAQIHSCETPPMALQCSFSSFICLFVRTRYCTFSQIKVYVVAKRNHCDRFIFYRLLTVVIINVVLIYITLHKLKPKVGEFNVTIRFESWTNHENADLNIYCKILTNI